MTLVSERKNAVSTLAELFADARRAVIFTGAGISTESGIPDFRSPGGIWERTDPVYFDDFVTSEDARRTDWQRRFTMLDQFAAAEPNAGHRAIAALHRLGRVSAVITQNIDGMHQRSGVPDDRVIELHGNGTFATCLECGERHELEAIRGPFEERGETPRCRACGGIVKAAIINFGQSMPLEAMAQAQEAALEADLFVAIGSSLVVYPAAGLPILAKEEGAELVILNREATPLDGIADFVIRDEIGPVLAPFCDKVAAEY